MVVGLVAVQLKKACLGLVRYSDFNFPRMCWLKEDFLKHVERPVKALPKPDPNAPVDPNAPALPPVVRDAEHIVSGRQCEISRGLGAHRLFPTDHDMSRQKNVCLRFAF